MRGLVEGTPVGGEGLKGRDRGVCGGGVAPMSVDGSEVASRGATDLGMMVGPTAEKDSAGGGTAVLATLNCCGGGVGGYSS
jgi:hypothetical protein